LACNQVRMTDGGLFMIHNSWTFAYGNAAELRDTANLLERLTARSVADYQRKTGATADQVKTWMDATTWFTAQEALDAKFIDVIDPNTKQADGASQARWNLAAYRTLPRRRRNPKPT